MALEFEISTLIVSNRSAGLKQDGSILILLRRSIGLKQDS